MTMHSQSYNQNSYQNSSKQRPNWDRHNSTFRWMLYLSHDKGYEFDGYSMRVGQPEKHDKQALFQDCVSRILACGYLDKTYQMEFYRRGGPLVAKDQDRLLLTMYPTYFVASNELLLDLSTLNFLQRVYDTKISGRPFDPKALLPARPTKRDLEAIDFSFSLLRFPTEDKLVEHCKALVASEKYPYKRIEAWWRKVKEAYEQQKTMTGEKAYHPAPPAPTGQQTTGHYQQPNPTATNYQRPAEPEPAPRPTSQLSPENQQIAANAQTALTNMHTRFTRGK